jgi:flagellar protein FliL
MSEEAVEQGEEEKPRGGKKKLIFIILGVMLLGGGGAAGAYFMGLFGGKEEHAEETAEHAQEGGEHAEKKEEGHGEGKAQTAGKVIYYDLPEFLVNLSSAGNQTSFVKMKITLELAGEADSQVAQEKLPVLQDHFNTYLRDLRPSDLSGSAGMYRLREELLARANKSLAPGKVNNILFREILVQ